MWFDPAAFDAPDPGYFGSSARGVIYGPDTRVLHAGIAKYISFTERVRMRLELTATNALNHPNYAEPNMNISERANVGVISDIESSSDLDQSGARSLRAGIRIEW